MLELLQNGGLMPEKIDFIDVLAEELKDKHQVHKDSDHNILNLGFNAVSISLSDDGDISIYGMYKWFKLGNIHEPDIIDRIKGAI